MAQVMTNNYKVEVIDQTLIITVDLTGDLGPSKSGKTTIIATTAGNVPVADGVVLGLNVYRPKR